MVEKQPKAPVPKNGAVGQHDQRKPEKQTAACPPESVAVDRPGFDLGGSTGKTHAGSGLGLGEDTLESGQDRRLPGRRGKGK